MVWLLVREGDLRGQLKGQATMHRNEAGLEAVHRRRGPRLFWRGVEGWLRQSVSGGKDNNGEFSPVPGLLF